MMTHLKNKTLLNKIIVFILLIALCIPVISFADDEPVSDASGKITVFMHSVEDGTPIQEAELELYKIADYSGEMIEIAPELVGHFTYDELIADTAECAKIVDEILPESGLSPVATEITDITGYAYFVNVPDGIYFISLKQNNETDAKYARRVAMVSVIAPMPAMNEDGTFQRVYECRPKCEISQTVNVSVVKKWKDGGHEDRRPDSISVSLYKDGSLIETVSFTADDGWKYEWTQLPADGDYSVTENDVPSIYRSTVVEDPDNVFSITNVYHDPEVPSTGDNMNLLFWAIMFGLAIILLAAFIVVFFGMKKKRDVSDPE